MAMPIAHLRAAAALPVGYKGPRASILVELKLAPGLTAKDLSGRLGLSLNAIRHHLKELEVDGLLEHEREQRGVGAPVFAYRLSQAGERIFPRRYESALTDVLETLVEREGREAVVGALEARYAALLPRVGSRGELNDLVGEMSGELGTSHSYIGGGDMYEDPAGASVGTLAVNVEPTQKGFRIAAILPGAEAFGGEASPLAAPHRGVKVGDTIVSVDGRSAAGLGELGELLVGRAGRSVALGIEGADGKVRVVEVTAMGDDTPNRYAQWVEANRRTVSERSQGRLGYMHLPDMDSAGLTAFVREFYPQVTKDGLVVDERWNGGGYVSQMVLERLRRRAIAGGTSREGEPSTYPVRAPAGPMAVLINENAGSDGDIFPNGFRLYGLGPLIGTRTWGGVVGIRGDKPFVDGGAATQPEYAWWDPVLGFGLEGKGVVPDIVVERTPADVAAGRDPQLDRAIAELMPKLGKDAPPKPPVPGKGNTSAPPAAR